MNMNRNWRRWFAELKRRMWGPMGSVVLHIGVVSLLVNFTFQEHATEWTPPAPVELPRQEDPPPLDPPVADSNPEEPLEPPDFRDLSDVPGGGSGVVPDAVVPVPTTVDGNDAKAGPDPDAGDREQQGITMIAAKSTLVIKSPYESRLSSGARDGAIKTHGAPGGADTEKAVLRALRWLKQEQKLDGSWDSPSVAMTGFALLCYLAHGEMPGSGEFGDTVERAIRYLVTTQPQWPRRYEWAIATYALCEAYGMTRVPMVKDAAAKGIDAIICGQRPTGGWCYGLTPLDEADDTSVMGWCAQALKAAQLAGVKHTGLDNAMKLAIRAFKANASPNGGFGYRGPGEGGLTGVGVLCMQLLGAGGQSEVQRGLVWLERATCRWDEAWLGAPLYYWYYVTQAKFHAGGRPWTAWNRQFASELVKNQIVLKGAGADGKDMGFWELPKVNGVQVKDHSTGLAYNTTLCCLMLEVYYKVLPTYQPPQQAKLEEDADTGNDIQIEVAN